MPAILGSSYLNQGGHSNKHLPLRVKSCTAIFQQKALSKDGDKMHSGNTKFKMNSEFIKRNTPRRSPSVSTFLYLNHYDSYSSFPSSVFSCNVIKKDNTHFKEIKNNTGHCVGEKWGHFIDIAKKDEEIEKHSHVLFQREVFRSNKWRESTEQKSIPIF